MREGVKGMIFILNPNPISLSFSESWLFNTFKPLVNKISIHLNGANCMSSLMVFVSHYGISYREHLDNKYY